MTLMKECSACLQNKLPQEVKDPRCFTISCNIGESYYGKKLFDLGANINLTPMSFRKLSIGEVRLTTVTLQLADISLAYPEGRIECVLVLEECSTMFELKSLATEWELNFVKDPLEQVLVFDSLSDKE
ncbi:gag-asp_proteas domain-containing protein [Gossypium australe]|uniref:Gag-asp_proteas domain-containing protein n=1 Tax=Gossypium australe TaxID=47621 RepID=A0A5B6WZ09_9ROSI|nr:gag-asp_proteas domain-containing protein [Gossypium australe]